MHELRIAAGILATAASVTIAALPAPAQALETDTVAATAKPSISAEQRARLAEKLQLINQIMRQVDTGREAVSASQRQWLLESMYKMSLGQVRAVGVPSTYSHTADALSRVSKMSAKAFGDLSDDLVYTPFNPCRWSDSRNVGGKINGVAGFDLANTGTTYGGVGACNPTAILGISDENLIGAIALNMTIVDTSAAASPGFATVRPAGSSNTTALVNWTVSSAGFQLGNAAVVSTDQTLALGNEFEIFTSGSVHAIVDFFGAFIMPGITQLDCVDQKTTIAIANGSRQFTTVNCPAGYVVTGGGASTGFNTGMVVQASAQNGNGWFASVLNTSGSSQDEDFWARCCRIPGR